MNIQNVKDQHLPELMKKKNVIGVGVGKKITGGKETDEDAVVIFVERKEVLESLDPEDAVPEKLEGVKTDVIETIMPEIQKKSLRDF